MPLCVPPGPRCGCVLAVLVPLRVYLGYMLSDTNTEIDLLSSGIAYWHLSKSATLLAGISYVPPPAQPSVPGCYGSAENLRTWTESREV